MSYQQFEHIVSMAREACAGSNIKELKEVKGLIAQAIWLGRAKAIDSKFMVQLTQALTLLENAKTYSDRLEPDTILCDILNELHKGGYV